MAVPEKEGSNFGPATSFSQSLCCFLAWSFLEGMSGLRSLAIAYQATLQMQNGRRFGGYLVPSEGGPSA